LPQSEGNGWNPMIVKIKTFVNFHFFTLVVADFNVYISQISDFDRKALQDLASSDELFFGVFHNNSGG
jgi:hypothetical protein